MVYSKYFNKYNDSIKMDLCNACAVGDLNKIKEIINVFHKDSDKFLHQAFSHAARYNLESVKYLLTSPELKVHPDIHFKQNSALYEAFIADRLDIANYLLTSPDLKEHANIHANDDICFTNMCSVEKYSVIEYLIFDYKIERTQTINEFLTNWEQSLVVDMFNKRTLNQELEKELNHSSLPNNKKSKI
jgi:hypothetical protein